MAKKFDMRQFNCADCGVNTDSINEYYVVTDVVWKRAKAKKRMMLCIGCLEKRLGRQLTAKDFTGALVNWLWPRSERLAARMAK